MKNITITLDEETAHWARIEAAHQDAMRRYLARTPTALEDTGRYPPVKTSTTVPVFVDTGVLVYARDAQNPTSNHKPWRGSSTCGGPGRRGSASKSCRSTTRPPPTSSIRA